MARWLSSRTMSFGGVTLEILGTGCWFTRELFEFGQRCDSGPASRGRSRPVEATQVPLRQRLRCDNRYTAMMNPLLDLKPPAAPPPCFNRDASSGHDHTRKRPRRGGRSLRRATYHSSARKSPQPPITQYRRDRPARENDRISALLDDHRHRTSARELERVATLSSVPNTRYSFAVTADSWHSVDTIPAGVSPRDSRMLIWFFDGAWLKLRTSEEHAVVRLASRWRQPPLPAATRSDA